MKLKHLQAGELRADALRDGTWFQDEMESEMDGEELRTYATGKERCVSVVQQLSIMSSRAQCSLLDHILVHAYP